MRIETDRLVLVHPRRKDAFDVYSHKTDDRAVIFTGGRLLSPWPEFEKNYYRKCDSPEKEKKQVYSVILKESDRYIGYCGFQYCDTLRETEILYGYSSRYWGNGYAFEAAEALLEYGFSSLGHERIAAAVNPANPASEKILRKLGMVPAGQIEWPGQGLVNKYVVEKGVPL